MGDGKVYTDFVIYNADDSVRYIKEQEAFADAHADAYCDALKKAISALKQTDFYSQRLERHMILRIAGGALWRAMEPHRAPQIFPERPNGGRWIAFGMIDRKHRTPGLYVGRESYNLSGERCERLDSYLNAKHLLENGRRNNLIMCGLQGYESSVLFYQGVQDAYREFGLTIDEDLLSWFRPNEDSGYRRFMEVWEANPGSFDGAICFCDSLAFGVYRAARKLGLSIPEDISVVGYDDNPNNDFTAPPLTSIHQPKDLLTQYCMEFALKCLKNEDTELRTWQLEPVLSQRNSVCPKK